MKTKQANAKMTILSQMAKNLPRQTTELQIVVRHFLANKHSIVVLQELIYNCRKAQTKKLKLSRGLQQNTN